MSKKMNHRPIEYRGYSESMKCWFYGCPLFHNNYKNARIFTNDNVDLGTAVHPDSIGQWTGQFYSKSEKVFEHDLVIPKNTSYLSPGEAYLIWYSNLHAQFNIDRVTLLRIDEYLKVGTLYENPEIKIVGANPYTEKGYNWSE